MRLLNVHNLQFRVFTSAHTPRYVVASHRWLPDAEAVLSDVRERCNTHTSGYRKVEGYAAFVRANFAGIDWLWIDTCCINQDSSQEVSEAVNSMFRWYSKAEACVVYLADVDDVADLDGFRRSDWFRRGWTLQELVVPRYVVFLTSGWEVVGQKNGRPPADSGWPTGSPLSDVISQVTGIPQDALENDWTKEKFGVQDKLRWVSNRETTREEDMTYCLFGLFDVSLPVIYGEGREKARERMLAEVSRRSKETTVVLDWASGIPYEKHYKDAVRKALDGTGGWLFQDPVFSEWLESESSQMLWLHGGAGAGKSTLISLVIRSLIDAYRQQNKAHPIYFYCSRNTAEPERADPASIMRSLVRQISDLPGGLMLHRSLRERYDQRSKAGDVAIDDAMDILLQSVDARGVTYILIDALDECSEDRWLLVEALEEVFQKSSSVVKILISSRDNHFDISSTMDQYPQIPIDAARNQADIEFYVRHKVQDAIAKRKLLRTERPADVAKLRGQIEECLCNGAQGMFRWVDLQLEYLYTLRVRSVLVDRLGKLPPDLEAAYRDLYELKMRELGDQQARIVRDILSWLLIAQRKLSAWELRRLLLENADISNDTVLDLCFAMVRLDHVQHEFKFAHPSVREFLLNRTNEFQLSELHDRVTSICLTLLTDPSSGGHMDYAAVYWLHHAQKSNEAGTVSHSSRQRRSFLCTPSDAFRQWSRGLRVGMAELSSSRESLAEKLEQALQGPKLDGRATLIPATFGFVEELEEMMESEGPRGFLNTRNHRRQNSLHLASRYGHDKIVELLLHAGADVNDPCKSYGCALQAASIGGHEAIVRRLLKEGAAIDGQGGIYCTALQAASYKGHERIVKLLLEEGADVNVMGPDRRWSGDALCAAAFNGHVAVVQLLLEKGADARARSGMFGSALGSACYNGSEEIVRLLLNHGADVNARGGECGNALWAAHLNKHDRIMQLLLDNGAQMSLAGELPHVQKHQRVSHIVSKWLLYK